ncbi:MAG TPA: hypothetical protein VGB89_08815, partial [Bacteroidota bacterium]
MLRTWLTLLCFILGIVLSGSLFAQDQSAQPIPVIKDNLRKQVRPIDQSTIGQVHDQGGFVPLSGTTDVLVNNNNGASGTANFTQSETD